MNEENKPVEETVEEETKIDIADADEPIEAIEKTVEDLKKKIQELAAEEAKEEEEEAPAEEEAEESDDDNYEIPEFITPEQKEKLEEIKDTAVKTVSDTVETIKTKAGEAMSNPEMQKTISFIKGNAQKAVETAKGKIDELRGNPNVAEAENKIKDFGSAAAEKITEGTKNLTKSVDELVNKPEVQETLAKARTAAAGLTSKAASALGGLFAGLKKKGEEAKEAAEDLKEEAEELIEEVKEEAAETAEEVKDKAAEAVEEVKEEITQTADEAADKAEEAAEEIKDKTEE